MKSRWTRAGVVGAMAVGAVAAVTSFGAPGGAQSVATTPIANPGVDTAPAISHDGRSIVFVSTPVGVDAVSSLVFHDRGPLGPDGAVLPATTAPIPGSQGAVNPAISGNGCIITWSVPTVSPEQSPGDQSATGDTTTSSSSTTSTSTSSTTTSTTTTGTTPSTVVAGSGSAEPDVQVQPLALQAASAPIRVLDRCVDPAVGLAGPLTDLGVSVDGSYGPAATSFDGSVIAVSDGDDVIRFVRDPAPAVGYTESGRFDGLDTDATDHAVSDRVDVSDDGSVIVFAAGPRPEQGQPVDINQMTVFTNVVGTGPPTTTAILPAADQPTVSADGNVVAASSGNGVLVVGRGAAPFARVDLGPGRRPSISADGNHVVFESVGTTGSLSIVSRTGQGAAPFATIQRTSLTSTIAPTQSGPVIDRLGTTVVSDRVVPAQTPAVDTDIAVTTVVADASFDAELFDLGTGDVGAVLTSTLTFSNRGPSSVGVASLTVDGTFVITADRCGAVIRPGTTCGIDVSFTVQRLQNALATVTLTSTTFGVAPITTQVTALGEAPPVSTPTTTSPTTPSSTGGSSTGGTSSGGSSTTRGSTGSSSTGSTRGSTTGGSTRGTSTGGSSTTGSSTTGSSTTGTSAGASETTTTVAPGAGVTASPAAFDFAPTIIDAGRRTGLVEVVNNGSGAVTVVGVRLEPAEPGAFQIVETTCAGESVAVGARCAVTLAFAPTAEGAQAVSLIASLENGVDIAVPVTGVGAPPPTMTIVPGVAAVGQVVTLTGAGFPTGVTVDVTWSAQVLQVTVDDSGTFDLPVLILPNTQTGPVGVSVAGQTDLFGDVVGTMLVTDTTDRSGPPVLEGIGPNIGR